MSPPAALDRIRRSARRSGRSRWLAIIFAAGLCGLLFAWPGQEERWIVAAPLILFLLPTAVRIRRTSHLLRQVRLEERFIEHAPGDDLLRRSLRHQDHLWQRSLLLAALRSLLEQPLPRLTSRVEKIRFLHERVRKTFSSMRPARRALEGVLLLASAGLWVWLLPLYVAPYLVAGAAALLTAALANEVLHQMERSRLATDFDDLVSAFCTWTLERQFDVTLRRDASRPYVHTVDYYAPPWLIDA